MIGQTVGHYRIVEKIGAGGMGEVYRAGDLHLGRDVAIKVLPAGTLADEHARWRFRKEAEALSKLNHPNIQTVFDFDTQEGLDFLVVELVPGPTLADKLASGFLPEKEIVSLGSQIAAALEEAHEHGVVHRDLKPSNIKVTPRDQVKVLDFGIAKLLKPFAETAPTESFTETHAVAGTLPYMAPEQLRGELVDARTDIWAAGAVLYEMATGKQAFSGNTVAVIHDAILNRPPTSAVRLNPEVSTKLEEIINKCLEKNARLRYQRGAELRTDLIRLGRDTASGRGVALGEVVPAGASCAVIDSIAVLPFENASADPDLDYLCDGITETIIYSLSQVDRLRVMARSSVFHYKGQKIDPQRVGRDLNVRAVLTGRIMQRGERLVIGTELVAVADGSQLWGEHYSRKLADIFAMQEEISLEIFQKLRLQLTAEEQERLAKRYTENTEAYQLYLQGRYYWEKKTEQGIKKALDYFRLGIDKDPTYALAYAGLADCYLFLGAGEYAVLPPRETMPKAKAAALKALELDDQLAEAYVPLAVTRYRFDRDWSDAERLLKRAIQLKPSYALAHSWYGVYLLSRARMEEGIVELIRAVELDPLSLPLNNTLGWGLYLARRYDQAITQLQKTIEMDPHFGVAYITLGHAYGQKGMYKEAIAALKKAIKLSGSLPLWTAVLGSLYAAAGKKEEALKVIEELNEVSQQRYLPPMGMALCYMLLNKKEIAFEWLEKAYQQRDGFLAYLNVSPAFDSLRSDPRFQSLLRRMNFPE